MTDKNIVDTDFPITWEDPTDAELGWVYDPTYGRDPLMPLDLDLRVKPMQKGIDLVNSQWGFHIPGVVKLFNGYLYGAMTKTDIDPEQVKRDYKVFEETVSENRFELEGLWKNNYLPEIKDHVDYWETFDLSGADHTALIEHLDETVRRNDRMWIIHHLILTPALLALSEFDEMFKGLLEVDAPFSSYDLLTGIGNKTVESGIKLWQLCQQERNSSIVKKILKETNADHVLDKLQQTTEGQTFWLKLTDYLSEYGKNSDLLYLNQPCWQEKPSSVFKILQHYINHPERNPNTVQKEHATFRTEAIAVAISQFEGYPQFMLDDFEKHLKAAQTASKLSEDHHYWIDTNLYYYLRQVCLALGKSLVKQQIIEKTDDIFYLSLDQLRSLTLTTATHFRTIINTQKINYQRYANYTPPPSIGSSDTPIFMNESITSGISRADQKFSGMKPVKATGELNQLNGNPGSSGKVTGVAKIVHTLAEADKINPGDILVAPSTLPAWSPLFSIVAAIVTDSGGVLSHTAIVAREYGIPAVLGTQSATATIQDGQILEVDGTKGLIRILDNIPE